MKKLILWAKEHKAKAIILAVGIIAFLFFVAPLIISFLFVDDGGIPVKWGAKDFLIFYGSFLAFAGTVFLGAVAIYQNETATESAKKANEINTINKIITIEHERKNDIEESLDHYITLSNPQRLAKFLVNDAQNSEDLMSKLLVRLASYENDLDDATHKVIRKTEPYLSRSKNNSFMSCFDEYHKYMKWFLEKGRTAAKNGTDIAKLEKEDADKLYEKYNSLFIKKEVFLQELQEQLDELLYGDSTLEEIKGKYKN